MGSDLKMVAVDLSARLTIGTVSMIGTASWPKRITSAWRSPAAPLHADSSIQSASEYENLLLRAIFFIWTFIHYLIIHITCIAILFFCFMMALESV